MLQFLEAKVNRKTRVLKVYIELKEDVPLGKLIRGLRALKLDIEDIQFEQDASVDSDVHAFILNLKSANRRDQLQYMDDIRKIDGIIHIEVL